MSEDMEIRNLSPGTRKVYLYNVALFARHFGKSPDLLGPEEIRTYQMYLLHERNLSWSYYAQCICALRLFYSVTLEKDWIIRHLPFLRKEKRLPEILSMEELSRFFRVRCQTGFKPSDTVSVR